MFVSGPDRFYVALQANVEEEGQGLNPWVQAYWSYSALVFDTNFNYRLPLWLTDGIASLLSNTIVSEKEIRFGSPIPSKVEMVRTAPLRPLAELFEVTRQSPYYTQGASRERFASAPTGPRRKARKPPAANFTPNTVSRPASTRR